MLNIELYKEFFKKESEGFKCITKKIKNNEICYEVKTNSDKIEKTFILSHGEFGTSNYLKPIAIKLLEVIPNARVILLDLPINEKLIKEETEIISEFNVYDYAKIINNLLCELKSEDLFYNEVYFLGWKLDNSIGLILDLMNVEINKLILLESLPVWESVEGLLGIHSNNKHKVAELIK